MNPDMQGSILKVSLLCREALFWNAFLKRQIWRFQSFWTPSMQKISCIHHFVYRFGVFPCFFVERLRQKANTLQLFYW